MGPSLKLRRRRQRAELRNHERTKRTEKEQLLRLESAGRGHCKEAQKLRQIVQENEMRASVQRSKFAFLND